jgi:hypothetical protein
VRFAAAAVLVTGSIGRALAQDDLAALEVADKAPAGVEQHAPAWRVLLEGAFERSGEMSNPQAARDAGRLSLDLRYQQALVPGLQAVLADRLDVNHQAPYGTTEVNTLKEAYLSWRESPERIFDIGRINVRNGVALGYNPTDYFKFGAVRQVYSINPASLRENRLGSVMLRGQQLWDGGSVTALVSPQLADEPSDGPFSADLGATNGSNRWLLAVSQRLSPDWTPQLLLKGEEHQPVQVGLNLTRLLTQATVAFVEVSAGRSAPLVSQAGGSSGPDAFHTRLATGLTYTTSHNLSLTLEYERDDAALTDRQWAALGLASLPELQRTLAFVSRSQDLPDRQALFVLAQWTDMLVQHLDLQGFGRLDLDDHSRLGWTELRYHWQRVDLALQGQISSGSASTIYGHLMPRWLGLLVVDWYLP